MRVNLFARVATADYVLHHKPKTMNTIRKAFLAMLLLWSLSMSAVSINSSCSNGNFVISGTADFTGSSYTWKIYRNNVEIFSLSNGGKNFSKSYPASTFNNGDYKLKVTYYILSNFRTETSSQIQVNNSEVIHLTNYDENANQTICVLGDSLVFEFEKDKWGSGNILAYSTAGFGEPAENLLATVTLNTALDVAKFPNFGSETFFTPGNYLRIEFSLNIQCISGTKILYLYSDPSCRTSVSDLSFFLSESSNTLDVFPNPVESSIQLKRDLSEFTKVELYSSQGVLIKEITGSGNSIDFSDKQTGLYYLKAYEMDGSVKMSKITKK